MKIKYLMYFLMATVVVLTTGCPGEDEPNGGEEKVIPLTGISIDQTELRIAKGVTKVLKVNYTPADATNKAVKWSVDNDAVEINESTGALTAKELSDVDITVTVISVEGNHRATRIVKVVDIPANGVLMEEEWVIIGPGKKKPLKANVLSPAASNRKISWKSHHPAIATIDAATGVVTGVSGGVAIITVKTDDGGFEDDCYVRVASTTNDLLNPGFEANLNSWVQVPQAWYESYYPLWTLKTTSAVTRQTNFTDANHSFFAAANPGAGAARFANNQTAGLYQEVTVISERTYWFTVVLGLNSTAAAQDSPMESILILSPDGDKVYHEEKVDLSTFKANSPPVIIEVSGVFTVPKDINKIRLQIASCNERNGVTNKRNPITLFDNCELRLVPEQVIPAKP